MSKYPGQTITPEDKLEFDVSDKQLYEENCKKIIQNEEEIPTMTFDISYRIQNKYIVIQMSKISYSLILMYTLERRRVVGSYLFLKAHPSLKN